jgi:hypothetical protein
MYHMYFLPQKAVDFEKSCVYCVVYVFFKTTKYVLILTSDVVQVAPLSRYSLLMFLCFVDTFIENHLKNNLYALIRYFAACFIMFLRHLI